jgi:hypothetical protein
MKAMEVISLPHYPFLIDCERFDIDDWENEDCSYIITGGSEDMDEDCL